MSTSKENIDLFTQIEGIQFTVEMGVCSSIRSFVNTITHHKDFAKLQKIAVSDPNSIIERMLRNASYSFDHAYENPYDTSAAVYYYVLLTNSIPLYYRKAERILGFMSNNYWSSQILRYCVQSEVLSKPQLGWKYWPTVLFYRLINHIKIWWRSV